MKKVIGLLVVIAVLSAAYVLMPDKFTRAKKGADSSASKKSSSGNSQNSLDTFKTALIIGNGGYNESENGLKLGYLSNPTNDADDMAEVLGNLGFEVILKKDLSKKSDMRNAVREFGDLLKERSGMGLFYYSGHGFQFNNVNYLMPLHADIVSKADVEDESLRADYVLEHMEMANNGVNIVILDACREGLSDEFFREKKGIFDGLGQGLAEMKAPLGSLIAYSTASNTTSFGGDAGERNSLYTKHLLWALRNKSQDKVVDLFVAVRKLVVKEVREILEKAGKDAAEADKQLPWELQALTDTDFCFGQCDFGDGGNRNNGQGDNKREQESQGIKQEEQDKISKLLETCQFRLNKNWLTAGSGGTALKCYQDVLALDANNLAASQGLANIEEKCIAWAEEAIESLKSGQSNESQKNEAKQCIASLLSVNPESVKLADLKAKLEFVPPVPRVGEVFQDKLKDGSLAPKMVVISAGSFEMGSNDGQKSAKPVHRVSVNQFAIGVYEITFEEYDRFCEATGRSKPDDEGWGRGTRPVINVSWNDSVAYTKWLSEQTGNDYRLPTEAEWEYAARAGSRTKHWWGDDIGRNKANCWKDECGDSYEYTSPVGSFESNGFGLYDTMGNVWEWTCSDYELYESGVEQRCSENTNKNKVLRGGSWYDGYFITRSDQRSYTTSQDYADNGLGFRILRTY